MLFAQASSSKPNEQKQFIRKLLSGIFVNYHISVRKQKKEKRNIWHIMTFFSIEDILNSIDMGNKKGASSLCLLEILATT